MNNDKKAAELVAMIQSEVPSGGVLLIVLDESALSTTNADGQRMGVISCDGAFRMCGDAVHSQAGADAIARIGREIGEAAREVIRRITNELGGSIMQDRSK